MASARSGVRMTQLPYIRLRSHARRIKHSPSVESIAPWFQPRYLGIRPADWRTPPPTATRPNFASDQHQSMTAAARRRILVQGDQYEAEDDLERMAGALFRVTAFSRTPINSV